MALTQKQRVLSIVQAGHAPNETALMLGIDPALAIAAVQDLTVDGVSQSQRIANLVAGGHSPFEAAEWLGVSPSVAAAAVADLSGASVVGGANPTGVIVTHPLNAVSGSNNGQSDWAQALLVQLPFSTSQWRLRIRNYDAVANVAQTGAVNFTGVWVGVPNMSGHNAGEFTGDLSSVTGRALTAFSTPADGSEFVTPWVTASNLQAQAGRLMALQMGCTATVGTVLMLSNIGAAWAGGAGRSAGVPYLTWPDYSNLPNSFLDIRFEYQANVPASTPILMFVGDSITAGVGGDTTYTTSGVFPHETWPGAAALRLRAPWVNMGVAGSTTTHWSAGNDWKWNRVDLTDNPPTVAYIALGTNDANGNVSLATFQTNYLSIINKLLTINPAMQIVAVTVPPANYVSAGAAETARLSYNRWLATGPYGVSAVYDADKQLYLASAVNTMDADYVATAGYPHLSHRGYQRYAAGVPLPGR